MKRSGGWTTIREAKERLARRWGRGYFLGRAADTDLFPLRLALCGPSAAEVSEQFARVQEWIQQVRRAENGSRVTIEWRQINSRVVGRNRIPCALWFESLDALAGFIGRSAELCDFRKAAKAIIAEFPTLSDWVYTHPRQVLTCGDDAPRLMGVLSFMVAHPLSGLYLRQISLPQVDSKFIESRKKLLSQWLDILLAEESIDRRFSSTGMFEQRYGFCSRPVLIRFRMVDPFCAVNGLTDLTVRADEFSGLDPDVDRVFVTENDINGLAFPSLPRTMVIFGRGYGFDKLAKARWLQRKQILYWGDIDTHGLAILNQFRSFFPQARSFLMTRQVLLDHRDRWVRESSPFEGRLDNLTPEEATLFADLKANRLGDRIRLEQEFIPWEYVLAAL
ncbi:MAG: hypothetical protein GF344_10615 [Chitinivibrionales bacterium]|nr:hypothetical protein [Chitinivibrionales bacterium]